jgi:hypothetical protein
MQMDFQVAQLFNGNFDPKTHIEQCIRQWKVAEIPSRLWVQVFSHSLGPIPKSWYIHEETRRQTSNSKTLADQFHKDLSFISKYLELKIVMQKIKKLLFIDSCKWKSDPVVCANHNQVGQDTYRIL